MIQIPEVDALDTIWSTRGLEIMPPMDHIPKEFKHDGNKWVRVVHDWFFFGMKKCKWTPKAGVDTGKALAAISACIGDFGPSHEHKTAGCAYLLSEWFEDVAYQRAK